MNDSYNSNPVQPQFPMKWHKFLIYFSLWAAMVLNLVSCITYFAGLQYGDLASTVYMVFPGMNIADKLLSFVFLALAVLSVVTRFSLAGFKANGPKLLTAVYILNIVASIGYVLLASAITKAPISDMTDSSSISSLVTSIAIMVYSHKYYNERASLFVN